ncbi:conserved repeat domain-containing protein [Friedmanniella luteola]|uniref:Conserved repeat domain-containing protein n=1 Tax=Friedmanniella luteola TaxID=546871 RepID=A0A1H1NBX9_9ACTN|nr:GEVED domain-containing protein [Friedmanniella luteola]SDR96390.1 conserved repeat domain-containing protein [Friedmanniella luteola]
MSQPAVPRPPLRALAVAAALGLALLASGGSPALAAPGYDYGDAPVDVDAGSGDPARALVTGPRLGATVSADRLDPDTGSSTKASESADGDDDDALAALPPLPVGRLTTLRLVVAVSRVTVPARLCGWVDLDLDRAFRTSERACVDVPAGARTAELRWDARAAAAGDSLVRLRIATAADEAELPDGPSASGEVEDHLLALVDPPPPPRLVLSLQTESSPTRVARLGEPVRYTYRVRNAGDVPVQGVTLTDVRVPPDQLSCSPALGAALAPSARLTCTATVLVTQDDLDFGALETAAEARAEAPSGDPDDPSDDLLAIGPATVEVRARPRLAVALTTAPARPAAGARVRATVTVTNAGNVTLTRVGLDAVRPQLSGVRCAPDRPARLAPGAELVCTGAFVVAPGDARRGRAEVRAGGRAEQPYGTTATRRDDVVARTTVALPLTRLVEPPAPAPEDTPTSRPEPEPTASAATPEPSARAEGLADSGGPGPVPALAGLLAAAGGGAVVALRARRPR